MFPDVNSATAREVTKSATVKVAAVVPHQTKDGGRWVLGARPKVEVRSVRAPLLREGGRARRQEQGGLDPRQCHPVVNSLANVPQKPGYNSPLIGRDCLFFFPLTEELMGYDVLDALPVNHTFFDTLRVSLDADHLVVLWFPSPHSLFLS